MTQAVTQTAHQTKTRNASPSSEKVAQARLLYDSGLTPLSEIRTLLGMSVHRFHAFRVHNGWPLRPKLCKPADEDEAQTAPAKAAAHMPRNDTNVRPISPERLRDVQMMIMRLEDAVTREFVRTETALARQSPKNAETSARTLSSLVKTLVELKKMPPAAAPQKAVDPEEEEDDDPPPRDIDELRAELARRLERLEREKASQ
jgi:hypothetical protein